MVGIVIISHNKKIAEGTYELAKQMAPNTPISYCGGLEDGSIGTDYDSIKKAIEEVISEDGVVILFDLGSALMTTQMVVEELGRKDIVIADGPLVEAAVIAAVQSGVGSNLEDVLMAVKDCKEIPKIDLT